MPYRNPREATLPHVAGLLTGEVLLTLMKSAGHATLQDRMVCKLQYSFLFPLSNLLAYPIICSSLLAKIEIRDYYLSQERDYHPLKTALMQSFPTIATGSSLLATMVFIHSQHHACKKSANSDVAACRRTPYRRGVAYPREVSRACDFRAHGLQTSILFLIPFIQFTCLPDCPLLTLGKDRNQRLLSQPRERLSSLKDSKNAVFLLSSEPKKLTRSR